MKTTCEQLADALVDFADGELSPELHEQVAGHLATCPGCAKQVAALRQSITLAGELWSERSAEAETAHPQPISVGPRHMSSGKWYAAAIAVTAAGILLAVVWAQRPSPSEPKVAQQPPIAEPQQLTMAQITLLLDQEETAARMAKTAELIRDKPTGEQFAQLTRTHLTRWYPHTAAGREAIDQFRNEGTEEN